MIKEFNSSPLPAFGVFIGASAAFLIDIAIDNLKNDLED